MRSISERNLERVIEILNAAAREGVPVVAAREMRCARCDQHVRDGAGVRLTAPNGARCVMCEGCWLEAEVIECD